MVWIKGPENEYINLDAAKSIFIKEEEPYDICVSMDENIESLVYRGNGDIEDSKTYLDTLMTKIK